MGEQHDLDYCLGSCAHPCAAPPLLAAIYEANQRNYHKGAYLSASMLASESCMRQTQYERMEPYYENVQRLFWPFRGTIIHGLLEQQDERIRHYGWLQELRLSTTLTFDDYAAPIFDANGDWTGDFDGEHPLVVTINGTTDLYNPWTRELADAKTMACAAAAKFIKGDYKSSWEAQTNIYAWLTARTPLPDDHAAYCARYGLEPLPGPNYPYPETLRIQGVSMMELPQTGRHYKPMRDSKVHALPEIRVWEPDEVEAFVRSRALEWFKTLVLGQKAPVVDKSSAWLCKSCSFNGERIPGERCFPSQERANNA